MKRLTVNIYRYGKYLAIGLVLAAYPGYVLYQHWFFPSHTRPESPATFNWSIAGMAVIFIVGFLLALFGLLSLLVNKAIFSPNEIRYRTLFKNYTIPCCDILHVSTQRHTVQKTTLPALLNTTKSNYRLITKSRNYSLSSFEFWGLDKEIQKIRENGGAR